MRNETIKRLTLKQIAEELVGIDGAHAYLRYEVPGEDTFREFDHVFSDGEINLYRDGSVYLLHCSTGLEIGMWDDLETDYPGVWAAFVDGGGK